MRATQRRRVVKDFDIGMKLARNAKGWTQVRLAREATIVARRLTGDPDVGVSLATVGMIESGDRNPSLEMAQYIAVALGCEPHTLGRVYATPNERAS